MFGSKSRRIAQLERELEETQVDRNTFEFALIRAREGMDEQTNEFFRHHPVYAGAEQNPVTGAGAELPRKSRAKKNQ